MDYNETVGFIYNLQKFGIKLGLQRIETLLSLIDYPHKSFDSIHIAGTNAKGSVSAITHSILMSSGIKTGLYTSPHLVSFTERIRIDNEHITEKEVIRYTDYLKSVIETHDIKSTTFFEFVTAMAFRFFMDNKVRCAVLETGMGGRLDATNVVTPVVSVITPISYDHREYLGDTIEKIAYEKAGIIKPSVPVVVSRQTLPALRVVESKARESDSQLFVYERDFHSIVRDSQPSYIVFDFFGPLSIKGLKLHLAGRHQAINAATSIMSAYLYLTKLDRKIPFEDVVRKGVSNATWYGRLQWISKNPDILLDGAHNLESVRVLKDFVNEHLSDRTRIFVIGIMDDKDKVGILSEILPIADIVIFTAPNIDRSAKPASLANIAKGLGFDKTIQSDGVADALNTAIKLSENKTIRDLSYKSHTKNVIIVTGSLYTVGEAMWILNKNLVSDKLDCFKV